MNYLSLEFFILFLAFFALYWSLWRSTAAQNALILLASYALVCTYSPYFAAELLLFSVAVHFLAQWIYYSESRAVFIFALFITILHLLVMKYFDFFREQSQLLLEKLAIDWQLPAVEILLPIGISYYTFHSITYLTAVYREEIEPREARDLFTFIAFFPTLIAGPICRAEKMLPQFEAPQRRRIIDYPRIFSLLIAAMIKKLWFAAWLEQTWSGPILSNPEQYYPAEVLAAVYAYTLQIYLDFSGYTDLVIALALLLGIRIPENFNMPYAATNLRDFWQRWHMSLSRWIRDYIYIPLGGSRIGFWRTQLNLLAAMLISGLWHGAASHFLYWGALHAFGIIVLNIGDRLIGRNQISAFSPPLARFITIHYVALTWAVFYSADNDITLAIFRALGSEISAQTPQESLIFIVIFNLAIVIYPHSQIVFRWARVGWKALPLVCYPLIFIMVLLLIAAFAPTGIPTFLYANF